MCSDFRIRGPNCVHLWVEFSIQNVVWRVSRKKWFPRPLFLVFLTKYWSQCSSSSSHPLQGPEKFLIAHMHSGILNVWRISVSITAQRVYAMYCIRTIYNSGIFSTVFFLFFFFSGICQYVQSYSAYSIIFILRHFNAYWDIRHI